MCQCRVFVTLMFLAQLSFVAYASKRSRGHSSKKDLVGEGGYDVSVGFLVALSIDYQYLSSSSKSGKKHGTNKINKSVLSLYFGYFDTNVCGMLNKVSYYTKRKSRHPCLS